MLEERSAKANVLSMNPSDSPTYSVSFRLQKTTTEFAFVSVPVTAELLLPQDDGTARLNGSALAQRAIAMGQEPGVKWHQEGSAVELHPVQMPPAGGQS